MKRSMPTAVFDTGIILQATISDRGPASEVMRLFDEEALTLYVSGELLTEIRDVLTHPVIRIKNARYSDEDIEALLKAKHVGTKPG